MEFQSHEELQAKADEIRAERIREQSCSPGKLPKTAGLEPAPEKRKKGFWETYGEMQMQRAQMEAEAYAAMPEALGEAHEGIAEYLGSKFPKAEKWILEKVMGGGSVVRSGKGQSAPLPADEYNPAAAFDRVEDDAAPPTIPADQGHLGDGQGNIDETKRIEREWSHWGTFLKWVGISAGASVARPDLDDGNRLYRHFLFGDGEDLELDLREYVEEDSSGEVMLHSAVEDAAAGAVKEHDEILAEGNVGGSLSFKIRSEVVTTQNSRYPHPATENWTKAIGHFAMWFEATVTVDSHGAEHGGNRHFKVDLTLHAQDRYNFNPGAGDSATGVPDSANGLFEVTGLGHQFTTLGTMQHGYSFQATMDPAHRQEIALADKDRQLKPEESMFSRGHSEKDEEGDEFRDPEMTVSGVEVVPVSDSEVEVSFSLAAGCPPSHVMLESKYVGGEWEPVDEALLELEPGQHTVRRSVGPQMPFTEVLFRVASVENKGQAGLSQPFLLGDPEPQLRSFYPNNGELDEVFLDTHFRCKGQAEMLFEYTTDNTTFLPVTHAQGTGWRKCLPLLPPEKTLHDGQERVLWRSATDLPEFQGPITLRATLRADGKTTQRHNMLGIQNLNLEQRTIDAETARAEEEAAQAEYQAEIEAQEKADAEELQEKLDGFDCAVTEAFGFEETEYWAKEVYVDFVYAARTLGKEIDFEIDYSLDGGTKFQRATILGDLAATPSAPGLMSGQFKWHQALDIEGKQENFVLRITPKIGRTAGKAWVSEPREVNNVAMSTETDDKIKEELGDKAIWLKSVHVPSGVFYDEMIGLEILYAIGEANAKFSLEGEYSIDGGTTFKPATLSKDWTELATSSLLEMEFGTTYWKASEDISGLEEKVVFRLHASSGRSTESVTSEEFELENGFTPPD